MSESTQIPEEAQEAIKQLSSQFNRSEDDLADEYTDLVAEEQEKGVSNPEKRALRRLSLNVKGSQMQSAEALRGVVLGASDPINTSASRIRNAKEFVKNYGPDKAVNNGLIKKVPSGDLPDELASLTVTREDGEEVYAVLDSNNNSPTHGEVLPAEDYIRYVYGGVYRSKDDGPHWFSAVLNAENEGDVPPVPPLGEPVKFEAVWVGESDQNNTIRLRFRDNDPFEVTDKGPGVVDLLEDDDLLGHVSLEEANADSYGRNDVVATYGSVDYMELAPDEGQSRRLAIIDPFDFGSDLSRTVWVPDHETIDFAEDSDVYIVGQVSKSQNDYPDSIEAVGIFPHPDYVVEREHVQSMADEGDDEGNREQSRGTSESTDSSSDGDESEPAPSPAEAGEDLQDPEEVAVDADDKESESGEQEAERGPIPKEVAEANYTNLQTVAAETEGVPGSGISEQEMRKQLIDAHGPQALKDALLGTEDGDDAGEQTEPDADADQGDDADETASADGGESVTPDEDQGDFEPTDEDDEWDW